MALDRQRQRRMAGRGHAGAGLSRRFLGPGCGRRFPAGRRWPATHTGRRRRERQPASACCSPTSAAPMRASRSRTPPRDCRCCDDSVREYAVADFPSLGDAARHYLEDGDAADAHGHPPRRVRRRRSRRRRRGADHQPSLGDFALAHLRRCSASSSCSWSMISPRSRWRSRLLQAADVVAARRRGLGSRTTSRATASMP